MASGRNGTLYIGVTGNLIARVWQHREGVVEGFTKKYGCKLLVWFERHDDIEAALKLDPGNAGALVERGLLRKQAGDLAGARRDFQAAAKADPNSEAAVTARDNLDALSGP